MSLLAKVRQDAGGVAAAAAAKLREMAAVGEMGEVREQRPAAPESRATKLSPTTGRPVEVADPDERWWVEPAAQATGAGGEVPAQPAIPKSPPAPCPNCADPQGVGGCPLFWEDVAGRVHCVECVPIPSRRMAKGAWRVEWDAAGQQPRWAPWEVSERAEAWLFAHLDAAAAVREREAAASVAASNAGF